MASSTKWSSKLLSYGRSKAAESCGLWVLKWTLVLGSDVTNIRVHSVWIQSNLDGCCKVKFEAFKQLIATACSSTVFIIDVRLSHLSICTPSPAFVPLSDGYIHRGLIFMECRAGIFSLANFDPAGQWQTIIWLHDIIKIVMPFLLGNLRRIWKCPTNVIRN